MIFQFRCMETIINERLYLGLIFLVGFGQVCLSSIETARFFEDQYHQKKSSGILDFFAWR